MDFRTLRTRRDRANPAIALPKSFCLSWERHMKKRVFAGTILVLALCIRLGSPWAAEVPAPPGVIKSEFIADPPPTASSHASSIVETKAGLLVAWFGGTRERALDVGIWLARHLSGAWTKPVEVATGRVAEEQRRHPCWNPVLFQPRAGPLCLFYKVGPSPESWWGMVTTSTDDGQSWTSPV